ncbi:MAG: hypothetical protein HYZ29_12965 [Myxococcales bacterium]|nr:hypothetical protein [Myxococcales bacterium]
MLALASCHSSSQIGTRNPVASHRGFIAFSFEAASFRSCGQSALIAVDRADPALSDVIDMFDTCDLVPCHPSGVYVELDGTISPEGNYGHMGMYYRILTARKIHYAARTPPPNTCE